MTKGEIFDRMQKITEYFSYNAKSNSTFESAYQAAKLINSKINSSEKLTSKDVEYLLSIINDTEDSGNYNGSGWLDYKMNFSALMKANGFEIDWNSKRMNTKKRNHDYL